jgi:putative sterol carrier protein
MTDYVQDIISKIKKKINDANLDLSGINDTIAFQFNLTGKQKGVFYIELKDHNINVEPYEYNNKDASISATKTNLEKIINGSLPVELAVLTGKVKIQGDINKVKMLGAFFKK